MELFDEMNIVYLREQQQQVLCNKKEYSNILCLNVSARVT